MVRFTSMHPPATEPYACVPQANRCNSKARFVNAALPVLMQTFRPPRSGTRCPTKSVVRSQGCCAQHRPKSTNRCKCLKQTSDGTQPTAGRLCTLMLEPGPMELCSSVGSERASSRATDFSITSIRLGDRPQRSSGEAPTQARAPLCECLRELEIGLGESQGWKQPASNCHQDVH